MPAGRYEGERLKVALANDATAIFAIASTQVDKYLGIPVDSKPLKAGSMICGQLVPTCHEWEVDRR